MTIPGIDDDKPLVNTDAYFSEHPEFKACRMEGHNWTRYLPAGPASYIVENEGTPDERWVKYRECVDDPDSGTPGCHQKHYKRWDRYGREINPDRDYPDDYVLKGERMPSRGELWGKEIKQAQAAHRDQTQPKRAAARKPKRASVGKPIKTRAGRGGLRATG